MDINQFANLFLKSTSNKIYDIPIIHKNGTIYELNECPLDLINDTYKILGLKSFLKDFKETFPNYEMNKENKDNELFKEFLETYLEDIIKCPLTLCTMFNPVVASDGFIYERSQIAKLPIYAFNSPKTREPLKTELIPISLISNLILYCDKHDLDVSKEKFFSTNNFKENFMDIKILLINGNYNEIINFSNFQLDYIHEGVSFCEFMLQARSYNDDECYKAHKYILDNCVNLNIKVGEKNILHLLCKYSIFINPSLISYAIEQLKSKLNIDVNLLNVYDEENKKPLDYVFERGHSLLIKSVLDCGLDFSKDILHHVITCIEKCNDINSIDLIKHDMIDRIKNVNSFDENSVSPLFAAIKFKKIEIINYLFEKGANGLLVNSNNTNALNLACETDDFEILNIFINKYNNLIYCSTNLVNACIRLSPDKALPINMINKLVNINAFYNNMSPLFTAIKYKKIDIINYLLETNANILSCDDNNVNAVTYACACDDYNIAKLFILEKACDDANYIRDYIVSLTNKCIAERENEEIIIMIDKLNNIHDIKIMISPLITAIKHGKIDIIKYLLHKGMNPTLRDEKGISAISCACNTNYLNIIMLFVARCDEYDDESILKLTNSCIYLSDDNNLIIDMINKLKDINKFDNDDISPLFVAIKCNKIEIVNYLLSLDANINTYNNNNVNAVFYACQYKNSEIIYRLIDLTADMEFETLDGWRLIHFTCRYCTSDIIEYVISKGVTLNVETKKYNGQDQKYLPINMLEFNKNIPDIDLPYLIDYVLQMMDFQTN